MTVAHKLAERGFDVTVYERRAWGGKARSTEVPGSAAGGRRPLPDDTASGSSSAATRTPWTPCGQSPPEKPANPPPNFGNPRQEICKSTGDAGRLAGPAGCGNLQPAKSPIVDLLGLDRAIGDHEQLRGQGTELSSSPRRCDERHEPTPGCRAAQAPEKELNDPATFSDALLRAAGDGRRSRLRTQTVALTHGRLA